MGIYIHILEGRKHPSISSRKCRGHKIEHTYICAYSYNQKLRDKKKTKKNHNSDDIASFQESKENTYRFDLVSFHPIYKHIRAIFLHSTNKSINAILASYCHIRFIFQPLQSFTTYKKEDSNVRLKKEKKKKNINCLNGEIKKKTKKVPGTNLVSSVPTIQ